MRDADVLLVIGERLGEMTTSGYTLLDAPVPPQPLIHVHPGADELGRVYQPALAIAATPGSFLAAMNALPPLAAARGARRRRGAHADYEAWRAPRPVPGAVDLWQIVRWLDARLPDDAILTNGAGNYTTWLHRLFRYRGFRTQLAPYSGAMGYGVPAAVAAKAVHPRAHRRLVERRRLLPDERAGARDRRAVRPRRDLRRRRQRHVRHDPHAPGAHVSRRACPAPTLVNPDFAALARAYGAHGETVDAHRGIRAGVRARAGAGKPALLHVESIRRR